MPNIVLIGTGPMAIAYAEVLKALKCDIKVVGRGHKSAEVFESTTGLKPEIGGIELFLENHPTSDQDFILVSVGTEMLMHVLLVLKGQKFKKILVEKPSAISIEQLIENEENLKIIQDRVYVAYNRRFYSSVEAAEKLIEEDGGLLSMHFEFTEWAHKIEPLDKAPKVKENWFFANSTHVVDLAFFLAGMPVDWKAYSFPGKLKWHNKTNYSGAGITENGVVFSYLSNWESAGRWGIELLTLKHRIYLKPLEKIYIQDKGSIVVREPNIDYSIDEKFKPGLSKQMRAFLSNDNSRLVGLDEQLLNTKKIYLPVLEGKNKNSI